VHFLFVTSYQRGDVKLDEVIDAGQVGTHSWVTSEANRTPHLGLEDRAGQVVTHFLVVLSP